MNSRDFIKNNVTERDGVYFIEGHEAFEYSDGSAIEDRIESIVRKTEDRSSDSRELERHITDWPTRYHFSRARTLAYRSLNIPQGANVLEVGSGCGSITRYLGEQARSVLALEGSPRRARITRSRTRELDNVTVLCASFQDVAFSSKFDLVVLNGVFEYAPLFVDHEHPHRQMLSALSELMSPDASLVIAIENQTGLRYFSSGREEHTNLMFDGIEGYAGVPEGARTFGTPGLKALLGEFFDSVETLLPLPDYKIPRGVISAKLLDEVDCAELFASTMAFDYVSYVPPLIHERLAWQALEDNGLLELFSNSLFMIASNGRSSIVDADWRGDVYSIQRRPEWSVRTRFQLEDDGVVWSRKSYLSAEATRNGDDPFEHRLASSPWQPGASVHTAVVRELCRRSSKGLEDRLRQPVLKWWAQVGRASSADNQIDGASLDRNWQNALLHEGEVRLFDEEWAWKEPVDPLWFLYRVVSKFARDEKHFTQRWRVPVFGLSTYAILKAVGRVVDVRVDLKGLRRAIAQESEFQAMIAGRHLGIGRPLLQALVPFRTQKIAATGIKLYKRVRGRITRMFARNS